MTEKEKELGEAFRQLSLETQENVISHIRFAVMAEKAVKKHYGIPDWEPPKQAGKSA